MPKFSIIIPVYNVEQWLDECIESVLGQTFKDFEVILVDDGSPDACPEMCDRYALSDSRVRVIHKPNGGVTSARKAGAVAATGEYILCVDSDDMVGPKLLEELSEIASNHSPDMIAFGYTTVENGIETGKFSNMLPKGFYSGEKLKTVIKTLPYNTAGEKTGTITLIHSVWAKAIRREIFVKAQLALPDDIFIGEDTLVTMTSVCSCSSVYVSEIFDYLYRYRQSSVTNSFQPRAFKNCRALVAYLRENCPDLPGDNIDAFEVITLVQSVSRVAMGMEKYSDFKAYLRAELTDDLQRDIRGCRPWKMKMRNFLRFIFLKYRIYLPFWIWYHR